MSAESKSIPVIGIASVIIIATMIIKMILIHLVGTPEDIALSSSYVVLRSDFLIQKRLSIIMHHTQEMMYTSCNDTSAILPKKYDEILSITLLLRLRTMATIARLSARNKAKTISQESFLVSLSFSMISAEKIEYPSVTQRGEYPLTNPKIIPVNEV